jgi:hypothetical protein
MTVVSHNFDLDGFQYPVNSGWLSTFGEIDYTEEEPIVIIDPRYWVSSISSNWRNSANWSYSSGGPGGASVPTPRNVCIFDSGGSGSCTLDASAFVYGIHVRGYPGTISQNNKDIVCSFVSFWSGTFVGDGSNIRTLTNFSVGDTCDFTSTDGTVSCDGTVLFSPTTGAFHHNHGTVSLDGSGAMLDTPNLYMSKLQFNASQIRINRTCYIEDQLYLESGSARTVSDATVHLRGDLVCSFEYNKWSSFNDFPIEFDGTARQSILNESGSVSPIIRVDKTVSEQVVCEGANPFVIRDRFILQDGTFNCNGRNIQVGL